jgi:hypothetical protein
MPGRRKKEGFYATGYRAPQALWEKFQIIAKVRGISPTAAITRLLADAVKNDRIPGIERLELPEELREVETPMPPVGQAEERYQADFAPKKKEQRVKGRTSSQVNPVS